MYTYTHYIYIYIYIDIHIYKYTHIYTYIIYIHIHMNPSISPWYPQIFLSPFRMGSYLMASKDSLESLQRLGAPWWMVAAWIVGEPAYEFGYHQITSKCQFYNLGIIKLQHKLKQFDSNSPRWTWLNLSIGMKQPVLYAFICLFTYLPDFTCWQAHPKQ